MARELPTSPKNEQKLHDLVMLPEYVLSFKNFVLRFFPWGQKGTPLADFSSPRHWQLEFMEAVDAHCLANIANPNPQIFKGAIAGGRGIGKSTLNAWMMLWLISTRPGMSIICVANSETQLKNTLWADTSRWLSMLPNKHWFEMQSLSLHPAVWYQGVLMNSRAIDSKQYSILCRTYSEENPGSFVGTHNTTGLALFMDEASDIPDSISDSALGFFTEINANRFWIMTSNPRRLSGRFYDIFNKPLDDWKRFQVDTRDVEGIDPSFHEGILASYGLDSDRARIDVLGQFPQQEVNSFIPLYKIEEALNREPVKDPYAPLIMGCDIAGEGGDNTVVVLRRGPVVEHIFDWSGLAVNTSSRKIEELINKYKPDAVVVDANGIGVQTYYYLEDLGHHVYAEKGQNRADDHEYYRNRRTELYVKASEWLEVASLPNHSSSLIGCLQVVSAMVKRELDILDDQNMLPEHPNDMGITSHAILDIVCTSPLYRYQQADGVEGKINGARYLMETSNVTGDPLYGVLVKPETHLDIAEKLGGESSDFITIEEARDIVKKMNEERDKQNRLPSPDKQLDAQSRIALGVINNAGGQQ